MAKASKPKNGKFKRGAPRQNTPKTLVALYGLDDQTPRGDAVRAVVEQLGFAIRTIGKDELGASVGAIAGLIASPKASKPCSVEAPNVEFMLVSGLSNAQLDQLLAALREADAGVVLKAQVTQHNRFWPMHLLISEVAKEHAAMSQAARTTQV